MYRLYAYGGVHVMSVMCDSRCVVELRPHVYLRQLQFSFLIDWPIVHCTRYMKLRMQDNDIEYNQSRQICENTCLDQSCNAGSI